MGYQMDVESIPYPIIFSPRNSNRVKLKLDGHQLSLPLLLLRVHLFPKLHFLHTRNHPRPIFKQSSLLIYLHPRTPKEHGRLWKWTLKGLCSQSIEMVEAGFQEFLDAISATSAQPLSNTQISTRIWIQQGCIQRCFKLYFLRIYLS